MSTFIHNCALKPEHDQTGYFAGLTHCEKRFVLHCWHVLPGQDLPVCCWCKQSAVLPKVSGIIEEKLFWAYVERINQNKRNSVAAPIGGLSMIYHEVKEDRGRGRGMSLEAVDLKTGIIRLYALQGLTYPHEAFPTIGRHLHIFDIVKRNLENLQNGTIKEQYRKEAIAEIEAQLWYLPKKEMRVVEVEKDNPDNTALARKLSALKGRSSKKSTPVKSNKKTITAKGRSKGKKGGAE